MNLQIKQEDVDLLTKAKELKDWRVLVTWKQKLMYQRFIALPANDMISVKEIANAAKEELGEDLIKIFNP